MKHTASRAWLAVTCKLKIDIARTYVEVKPVVCIAMMYLISHILLFSYYDAVLEILETFSARSLPSGRVGEFSLDLGHGTAQARFLARNAVFLFPLGSAGVAELCRRSIYRAKRGWSWDRLRYLARYRSTEIASEDIFSPA